LVGLHSQLGLGLPLGNWPGRKIGQALNLKNIPKKEVGTLLGHYLEVIIGRKIWRALKTFHLLGIFSHFFLKNLGREGFGKLWLDPGLILLKLGEPGASFSFQFLGGNWVSGKGLGTLFNYLGRESLKANLGSNLGVVDMGLG